MAVKIQVFWVVMPCTVAVEHHHNPTLCGITTQKTSTWTNAVYSRTKRSTDKHSKSTP